MPSGKTYECGTYITCAKPLAGVSLTHLLIAYATLRPIVYFIFVLNETYNLDLPNLTTLNKKQSKSQYGKYIICL